jgi:nucleotide-binding universal stress UspA family protein
MEESMLAIKNILVPTDFSEASDAALTYGRELAGRFGATLHLLHATDNLQLAALGEPYYGETLMDLQRTIEATARKRLEELAIDSDRSGPPTRRTAVTSTAPALAIVEYARSHQIDLIVMGTHGRGPLTHLVMGSVAERVVRIAPCPVLTVRHPQHDFVWPDTLTTIAHA